MNRTPFQLLSSYLSLRDEHRTWLRNFPSALKNWNTLVRDNIEAALNEALVRRLLQSQKILVRPGENGPQGGPDFLCKTPDNTNFACECTVIEIKQMTKEIWREDIIDKGSPIGSPVQAIWRKIKQKQRQGCKLDVPVVVAVGTLHYTASVLFDKHLCDAVLRTNGQYEVPFPWEQAHGISGRMVVSRKQSGFWSLENFSSSGVTIRNSSVSAVLLCGFGCVMPNDKMKTIPDSVLGIHHPNPCLPFPRAILAGVPFSRLKKCYRDGRFQTTWR